MPVFPINDRFPVLSTIARVMRALGVLLVVLGFAGVLMFAYARVEDKSPETLILLGLGIGAIVAGILFVALAELIGVAFAIELNTRRTEQVLAARLARKKPGGADDKTSKE